MRPLILALTMFFTVHVVTAAAQPARDRAQMTRDLDEDLGPGVFRDCSDCPEMKQLPAGSFTMGAAATQLDQIPWQRQIDGARILWESPQKNVNFAAPFAIGRFEVTRGQFRAFIRASGRAIAPDCVVWAGDWDRSANGKTWADAGIPQRDDHPAVCVSKEDAEAYAAWLTQITGRKYMLPTEAQWEYALRAGTEAVLPWGDNLEDACAYANLADATLSAKHPARPAHSCSDGWLYTAPVGMKKPNAWGLYDMAGNVWEWVADCWTPNHDKLPADGAAVMTGFCGESPLRGGAYGTGPMFTRISSRGGPDARTTRQSWIGFRVAAEVQAAKP